MFQVWWSVFKGWEQPVQHSKGLHQNNWCPLLFLCFQGWGLFYFTQCSFITFLLLIHTCASSSSVCFFDYIPYAPLVTFQLLLPPNSSGAGWGSGLSFQLAHLTVHGVDLMSHAGSHIALLPSAILCCWSTDHCCSLQCVERRAWRGLILHVLWHTVTMCLPIMSFQESLNNSQ